MEARCKDCSLGLDWDGYEATTEIFVSTIRDLMEHQVVDAERYLFCPYCGRGVKRFWAKAGCDYEPPEPPKKGSMAYHAMKQSQEIWLDAFKHMPSMEWLKKR